jgi:hypothetical protein
MKKTLLKILQSVFFSLMLVVLLSGCEIQEIIVPEREFFIAKEWKMDQVSFNGKVMEDEDMDPGDTISTFRLKLIDNFTFTQTDFDGTVESGNWALIAGLSQLILFVNDPSRQKSYQINAIEVRQLDITLMQGLKQNQAGQWSTSYILVPVKGQ